MSILGWPKHLQLDDLDWVLADTLAASQPRESQLGLDAALDLYMRNEQREDILQRIHAALALRPDLLQAMDRWLTPRTPSAEEVATNAEFKRLQAEHQEQERQRDNSWETFIAELRADPISYGASRRLRRTAWTRVSSTSGCYCPVWTGAIPGTPSTTCVQSRLC
jgi:hypothetical protein